ncbi:MAG: hypothetical protein JNJ54_03750 [Myxococcaceae bacterium]|nr:hypothetical protein [Myxococcaceae bacterium]
MPHSARVLSFAEADALLDGALTSCFEGSYETVALFEGDVELDGDFLPAMQGLGATADLIAISGDLTVRGDIALWDSTPGLFVGGSTTAETLQGGDCEISINGGTFRYLIYGYYNDGILDAGTVTVPWVINSDHDLRVSAEGARRVDNFSDDDAADWGRVTIPQAFLPEVLDEDSRLDVDAFLERLRAGLPVLKPGAMTAREAALAFVHAARERRDTALDLTRRKLKAFPSEILEMPWLEKLVLDDNDLGALPDDLDRLSALRELSVADCGLARLPDAVTRLSELRVLRVAGNRAYDFEKAPAEQPLELPAGLGALTKLEVLDVSGLSFKPSSGEALPELSAWRLPESAGSLKRLRRLVADGTNVIFPRPMFGLASLSELELKGSSYAYLRRLPEGVTTFPNLVRLDLRSNFLDELPASLLDLVNLEELNLHNALGLVTGPLPDLSRLPKLRVLALSGGTDHTRVRVPAHALLESFLSMPMRALESLRVDRWGKNDDDRPKPPAAVFEGLGRLHSLQRVDLSFNDLDALPESLYALPALVELDLRFNALPAAVRARVIATFPNAKIDLRSQRVKGEASAAAAVQANELIKAANRARDREQWSTALETYDEALAQYASGSANSDYGVLYALYSKLWIHGKTGNAVEGLPLARRCLELVPPVWQLWHFTDEGQFHREVVRYATNFLAWELLKGAPAGLDEALSSIERGAACVDGAEHAYVHDTHARVLLALGRTDEAWREVLRLQRVDASFEPSQDLFEDARYQAWLRGAGSSHRSSGTPSPAE